MTDEEREDLRCNVLILVTTPSERKALEQATKEAGLSFQRRHLTGVGEYYRLGMLGSTKVNAAPTEMGPLGHKGSAARAMLMREKALELQIASSASGIIQLGMAFGIDSKLQSTGDVLVSTSVIRYDNRDIVGQHVETPVIPPELDNGIAAEADSLDNRTADAVEPLFHAEVGNETAVDVTPADPPYKTDYKRAVRWPAKQSLLRLMQREYERGGYPHKVHFGGLLSGGARIFSRRFLKELVNGVPAAEDGIIGGDMEGVGLLSVSPPESPIWIVVKSISDFADENRGRADADRVRKEAFRAERFNACLNSARFVLRALANAELQ